MSTARNTGISKRWLIGLVAFTVCVQVGIPFLCLFVLLALRPYGPELSTIDGPENGILLSRLEGRLILCDGYGPSRNLRVIALPERSEELVTLAKKAGHFSAIDARGRLVYWTSSRWSHEIRVHSLTSEKDEVILKRRGRLNSNSRIALSPEGHRIALLQRTSQDSPWLLEVFRIDGTLLLSVDAAFTYGGPRWFPDGRRLAFGSPEGVRILDTVSGEHDDLPVVGYPCVGPRGYPLLVKKPGTVRYARGKTELNSAPVRRVEEHDEQLDSVLVPGLFMSVLASIDEDLVLYEGLPTTGAEQRSSGAFKVGPQYAWTIKVADLSDGSFATVVPYFGLGRAVYSPVR